MKLFHNSRNLSYREPFGAVKLNSRIRLSLKIIRDKEDETQEIKDVSLHTLIGDEEQLLAMSLIESDDSLVSVYSINIDAPSEGGLIWYYFVVTLGNETITYYGNNAKGYGGVGAEYDKEPKAYQITVYEEAPAPSWFKDGVIYQIFPDRFARDDNWKDRAEAVIKANQGKNGQQKFIEEDWYKPAYYIKDEEGKVTDWPFYGGSLKGIEDKLDYLKMLGVSVIYLNPVFDAVSNHRYDTSDYMKIDPMLGTDEDFRNLMTTASEMGIKIVLDGVFSHTGSDSLYFDKYGNYRIFGAYRNMDSPYREWYNFDEKEPCGYKSWWGVEDLPEVNEENPSFKEMITGDEGVLAKWTRLGASGWRLDVADELPDSFIQSIRTRLKKENPDSMLLGEVWEDASNKISYNEKRKFLMGRELDGTMNYPLREILMGFAQGNMSSEEAGARLMSLKENYPPENFYAAMNLIGSHDRERILTIMGADEDYDRAARRVKLLSVLQYALPGVPSIYYGDEAGMTGLADPANRSGFIWNKENPDLQKHFRLLGVLYHNHPTLKSGDVEFFKTEDNILSFIRWDENETILVIANRSSENVSVNIPSILNTNETGEKLLPLHYGLDLITAKELEDNQLNGLENFEMGAQSVSVITLMSEKPVAFKRDRAAGVLCHISSIPGGKLGTPAYRFVDYLASAGMKLWQVLPLNPTGQGGSPYSSDGAFAGNIDFVNKSELPGMEGYQDFCSNNAYWLQDYAIYTVLKEMCDGKSWTEWPEDFPKSSSDFVNSPMNNGTVTRKVADCCLWQYYFACQWEQLRSYAKSKGVEIIGDLPIFVSKDSADVWANPEIFRMQTDGNLSCHAGVPPDYFSPEGQNWGNPLYNWDNMKEDGYLWWKRRLDQCRQRYDYIRLDHFRSFSEYYAIPEDGEPVDGKWQNGPGLEFFRKIEEELNAGKSNRKLNILAEDLGQLDTGVSNLIKLTGYPGMNIWQFSKDEMMAMSPEETALRTFYSGTHDNQTLVGWCQENGMDKNDAFEIIGTLYRSSCPWVIIPLQDMFLLGDEARMNVPGTVVDNWSWHVPGADMESAYPFAGRVAGTFRNLAMQTGRLDKADGLVKSIGMKICNSELSSLTDTLVNQYSTEIAAQNIAGIDLKRDSDAANADRRVIAIDMGGTNIRVSRILLPADSQDSYPVIEERVNALMPGREEQIYYTDLFDLIADMIIAVDSEEPCSDVGFAFSFPGSPEGRDERIVSWAKELKILGGEGFLVGDLLNASLIKKSSVARNITVVNDTVATLLSGNSFTNGKPDDICVSGYILGTGSNICFRNQKSGLIYNLESGNYSGFQQSRIDYELDQASVNPGVYKTEKMISGAYRVNLMKRLIAEAQSTGAVRSLSTEEDRLTVLNLQKRIDERSAQISAILIAASIIMATEAEIKPALDEIKTVYTAVDGSVFWKTENLADLTNKLANEILKPYGYAVGFIKTEEATLLGAAYATQE